MDEDQDEQLDQMFMGHPARGSEVGYGKPPKETQFKKGKSCNPGGRPKKKRTSTPHDIFDQTFNTPLPVKIDGRPRNMTGTQAIFIQLRNRCMKGDLAATRVFCQLFRAYSLVSGPEDNGKLDELMQVLQMKPAAPGEYNE